MLFGNLDLKSHIMQVSEGGLSSPPVMRRQCVLHLSRDAEEADVEKERIEQAKGPAHRAHELDELAKIYESRGVSPGLARMVCPMTTYVFRFRILLCGWAG